MVHQKYKESICCPHLRPGKPSDFVTRMKQRDHRFILLEGNFDKCSGGAKILSNMLEVRGRKWGSAIFHVWIRARGCSQADSLGTVRRTWIQCPTGLICSSGGPPCLAQWWLKVVRVGCSQNPWICCFSFFMIWAAPAAMIPDFLHSFYREGLCASFCQVLLFSDHSWFFRGHFS